MWSGVADPARFRAALTALLGRHEILRCAFQRRSGMKFPFQVVRDSAEFAWTELDVSGLPESKQNTWVLELLHSPVEIENGPVVHAALLNLGADRHALAVSFSTLCVDNASLDQIASEIRASLSGATIPGEVLQYADYSEWQNEWLRKDDEESRQAAQFWQQTQLDTIPLLALPLERKRVETAGQRETVAVTLDSSVLPSDPQAAENFLLAGWQVFLWRMTGQQEFVLGYRADGRNHEEFQGGLGVFSKTLPFSVRFDGEPSFADFLSQSSKTRDAILEWQDYFSADRVGQRLTAGFDFSSTPDSGDKGMPELARLSPAYDSHITLRCAYAKGSTALNLEFDTACFASGTVAHFAEAFSTLCRAAAMKPSSPVGALPITSEAERRRVTVEFNQTKADFPRQRCIHQLFEERVEQYPQRPALRFGERELSYAQLNAEANRIAHLLRQNGVGANVPVGLCVERSAEMIIGLLGILKSGGCYLPLIPDNPKARLAHQLSESGAPVLLTEAKNLERLPDFAGKVICLDRDRTLLDAAPSTNPDAAVSPNDLVYVIYTSGSTGVPKGVAVRHINLVNYSHFICRRLKLDEEPAGLHFATVSTIAADLGNTCIFPSLISGGCLHVIGYETAMAPAVFADYSKKHPIDVLKITPSHLASLLDSADASAVLPRKFLVLGGEISRWDFIDRIRKAGSCSILNHYGPTEATVGCCTFSVDDSDVSAWEPASVPVGQPIANDRVYILDQHLQPLPVGVAGELCIGGAGIAHGYLKQPQQTAEKFIEDSFVDEADARIYRTGDLARFLPDGNVEFLGRIDQQVKIRGFRVEPPEIETVLKRHPAVKQAAVVAFDDKSGEKRLAAYVAGKFRTEELRAFLAQQLPDYMVPATFVAVDSLPLTANGKLDVRALPSPEAQPSVQEMIAPRTPEEEKLAEIWRQVLKLDRVGVSDDFFQLGGHSLLATQIISRIRNQFRVQMPLQVFLQNPTIAALAGQIATSPAIESEQEEMARLLQELDGLSEEEAERLLAAELQKDESGSGR